ncbi:DUF389 domain-containing protein [Sphingomonas montanisoli]|uniref:DUF389 domain-containing protein n=1 Tax=Sphingomonas montanisoli TaxID=2606412 RepID=A0A5D9C751_9SPHN|nr:DUF389 domain-containing protein [Sphingomonas montanisoli]TZG27296.1 DUF389 domain-containing protein [Sphingomonas montanisoli]
MNAETPFGAAAREQLDRFPLYRWWRRSIVGSIDHEHVMEKIIAESGWSPRYAFMTMMSAGIAVLGLLLSSPAVVIGAMLISPLMSPILGLGFSLALFDFAEMRRALIALAIGSGVAVMFTAIIVLLSPLQAPTPEIIARTRPNLFDLAVALFAALAGTFAIIRGRGDTVVGVAIATALMPPLAVVGYGLATWNLAVLGGAFALFVTNFVTIALSATIMARIYGFGHHLSSQQSWTQTVLLLLVFIVMAIPLGVSLRRIATEAVIVSQVRSSLNEQFDSRARVTQLDVNFDKTPIAIRSVVITPRDTVQQAGKVEAALRQRLKRLLTLQLDQVVLDPGARAFDAQKEELRQAGDAATAETALVSTISRALALAAGTSPEQVLVDRDHRRASVAAAVLPGADLATYRTLEQRAATDARGWTIALTPPQLALPEIGFADNSDELDEAGLAATEISIWAAQRWNLPALAVPGLPDTLTDKPLLAERRARRIADLVTKAGLRPTSAPAEGQRFRLAAPTTR